MSQPVGGVVALVASLIGGAATLGGAAVSASNAAPPAYVAATTAPTPVMAGALALRGPQAETTEIRFEHPLPGETVNSPFGLRRLPWEEQGRLHAGLDIAAYVGEPVRATSGGMVVDAGPDGGYGRMVEIAHGGGVTSLYAHLARTADGLKPGDIVNTGEVVGFAGSSGVSTGAHLHFEIRKDGAPLNPALFLGQRFASLAELPIKAASRIPRGVRIAYVSEIPVAKKAMMLAKLEDDKAEAAAESAATAPAARPSATLASPLAAAAPTAPAALPTPPVLRLDPADAPISTSRAERRVRATLPAASPVAATAAAG